MTRRREDGRRAGERLRALAVVALLLPTLPAACGDGAGPSDYDAGAVVRGVVVDAAEAPVVGAAIEVNAFVGSCTSTPIEAVGNGVVTDGDGAFEGRFGFLSSGPVTALCTEVRVLDGAGPRVLADTLVARPLRFDARGSDTLTVEMTAGSFDIEPR